MRLQLLRVLRSQLSRPLMRWGIRLPFPNMLTCLFVFLIVFGAGFSLAMAEHTRNGGMVYDDFYEATNLADLSATSSGKAYPHDDMMAACDALADIRANTSHSITQCETRYLHKEKSPVMKENTTTEEMEEVLIPTTFHGIDISDGSFGHISTPWLVDDQNEDVVSRIPIIDSEVVIDWHVHLELDVSIGDEMEFIIKGERVSRTVVGYANQARHLYYVPDSTVVIPGEGEFVVVYMPMAGLLSDLGTDSQNRTMLLIDVNGTPDYDLQDTLIEEGPELREMQAELAAALNEQGVRNVRVEDRSGIWSVELLRQDIEGSKKSQPLFLGVLIGVSALTMAISLDRLVRRQSREIAVLASLGTPSSQILLSYLSVPLVLGIIGTSISIPFGWKMSEELTLWYFEFIGVPVVEIQHHNDLAAMTALLTMAILLIFGLYPAWRATRLNPLEVMRQQPGRPPSRMMATFTGMLPASISLGIRSTFRRPMRLGATVVGLGLAMVLVGGTMIMVSSMESWFSSSLKEAEQWDARVMFNPYDSDDVRQWADAANDSIEQEWVLAAPGNVSGDARTLWIFAMEDFSEDGVETMHASRLLEGRLPEPGAEVHEALVDHGVAKFIGVGVGDNLTVVVGVFPLEIQIVGIVDEMTRSVWLYYSDAAAPAEAADIMVHNILYLRGNLTDSGVEDIPGASVSYRQDSIDAFEKSWESQQIGFKIFLFIGWSIAIAVLLNTLMINLTEHDTEFATLRILGASSVRLSVILLVESIVIGLLGAVVGILASILTANAMMASFSTWAWTFPISADPMAVVLIGVYILVAAIVITPVGIWRIRRMDLVEKAKEYAD